MRIGPPRSLTPTEVRSLPAGARGTLTADIEAMSLGGLHTVAPYLHLTLRGERGDDQVLITADQSVYRPALRQLRIGRTVTVVVRVRDALVDRLVAESLTLE